ncbi:hybrid sensor histidine kinase/response regulator transcription factor [Flavivirga algicola]|uniref:histidine kinase n=1 Tax=Flavivirga algicola TaxID=2729136 RepID=A0ABX1RVS0_9FLAO|nr:hybrid sensor histidine kinase/response regulator transcription factor [Flavivirga algicola]NMH87660.1 response regulator [Flavivirga algicola]
MRTFKFRENSENSFLEKGNGKMSSFVILFIAIFAFKFTLSQSSDYNISALSNESDITQNTVSSILTDDMGFLWFGKMDGLYKYNGYDFETFTTTFNKETGLSNPWVTDLKKLKKYLIVGTKNGLNILSLKTQKLAYFFPSDYDSSYNDNITCIDVNSNNNILVGTKNGLLNFSVKDSIVSNVRSVDFENFNKRTETIEILQILQIDDGCLVRTSLGLFFLGTKDSKARRIVLTTDNDNKLSGFNTVYVTKSKYLLIASDEHVFYLNLGQNPIKTNLKQVAFPLTQLYTNWPSIKKINNFLEDRNGNIIIGTQGEGLFIYNRKIENWQNYRHERNYENTLKNDFIRSLYLDKSGVIVIGTYAGVNILNTQKKRFELINSVKTNVEEEEILNVHAILEDQNKNLWIGTRGKGIFIISKNKKEQIHITNAKNNALDHVQAIIQDKQKQIWVGTQKGVFIIKDFNGSLKHVAKHFENSVPDLLPNEYVYEILEDNDSNKWISTASGLYLYSANKHLSKLSDLSNGFLLKNKIVYTMMLDSFNRVWLGTSNELIVYVNPEDYKNKDLSLLNNLNSIRFHPINIIPKSQRFYTNYYTYSMEEVDDYGIMVGTNFGLCKIDIEQRLLMPYFNSTPSSSSLNLESNYIYGLLYDDINSMLWMSSNRGLLSYNFNTKQEKQYILEDGLQSLEFNGNSIHKNIDETFFFGGANGINVLKTTQPVERNKFNPQLVLTKLIINGEEANIDNTSKGLDVNIAYAKKIKLTAEENNIGFEFSSLHWPYASNNLYKCKLTGIDDDWISLGHKRSINYANLPEGTYVFKLMGTNNDRTWTPQELNFELEVLPVWYKTWWMISIWCFITFFVITAFVWILLKNRDNVNSLKIKELESDKIQEIYESKLVFFTNLSHEFRTPLSLILDPFQSLMLQKDFYNKNKDLFDIIKNNVNRLRKLIDQIMDFRKFEYGKLSLKIAQGDIVSTISTISNSFIHHSKLKNVDYNIVLPDQSIQMFFDTDSIEKILYNLLSNAFKSVASGGSVSILVNEFKNGEKAFKRRNYKQISGEKNHISFENHIYIKVKDNGVGISSKNLERIFTRFYQSDSVDSGTGIGLYMVKQFTEMHFGSIFIKSKIGKGASFVIVLPKNDDLYSNTLRNKSVVSKVVNKKEDNNVFVEEEVLLPVTEKNYTVVVVEDNDELRMYLKKILGDHYNVYTANNGLEGLDLIVEESPDLIISDIVMPEIDGSEMCKRIKENFETSHIPVILLTAKAFDNQIIEGINLGADAYITKPFNKEILIAKINNLIKNREKLRLIFQNSKTLEPSKVTVTSIDEKLVIKLKELVEEHIQNTELTLDMLATEVGISRAQLFRKVKALTGLTPNNFIKSIRLKYAAQLLDDKKFQITEVAFLSGFAEASYFSRCFKETFGCSPKAYKNTHQ